MSKKLTRAELAKELVARGAAIAELQERLSKAERKVAIAELGVAEAGAVSDLYKAALAEISRLNSEAYWRDEKYIDLLRKYNDLSDENAAKDRREAWSPLRPTLLQRDSNSLMSKSGPAVNRSAAMPEYLL